MRFKIFFYLFIFFLFQKSIFTKIQPKQELEKQENSSKFRLLEHISNIWQKGKNHIMKIKDSLFRQKMKEKELKQIEKLSNLEQIMNDEESRIKTHLNKKILETGLDHKYHHIKRKKNKKLKRTQFSRNETSEMNLNTKKKLDLDAKLKKIEEKIKSSNNLEKIKELESSAKKVANSLKSKSKNKIKKEEKDSEINLHKEKIFKKISMSSLNFEQIYDNFNLNRNENYLSENLKISKEFDIYEDEPYSFFSLMKNIQNLRNLDTDGKNLQSNYYQIQIGGKIYIKKNYPNIFLSGITNPNDFEVFMNTDSKIIKLKSDYILYNYGKKAFDSYNLLQKFQKKFIDSNSLFSMIKKKKKEESERKLELDQNLKRQVSKTPKNNFFLGYNLDFLKDSTIQIDLYKDIVRKLKQMSKNRNYKYLLERLNILSDKQSYDEEVAKSLRRYKKERKLKEVKHLNSDIEIDVHNKLEKEKDSLLFKIQKIILNDEHMDQNDENKTQNPENIVVQNPSKEASTNENNTNMSDSDYFQKYAKKFYNKELEMNNDYTPKFPYANQHQYKKSKIFHANSKHKRAEKPKNNKIDPKELEKVRKKILERNKRIEEERKKIDEEENLIKNKNADSKNIYDLLKETDEEESENKSQNEETVEEDLSVKEKEEIIDNKNEKSKKIEIEKDIQDKTEKSENQSNKIEKSSTIVNDDEEKTENQNIDDDSLKEEIEKANEVLIDQEEKNDLKQENESENLTNKDDQEKKSQNIIDEEKEIDQEKSEKEEIDLNKPIDEDKDKEIDQEKEENDSNKSIDKDKEIDQENSEKEEIDLNKPIDEENESIKKTDEKSHKTEEIDQDENIDEEDVDQEEKVILPTQTKILDFSKNKKILNYFKANIKNQNLPMSQKTLIRKVLPKLKPPKTKMNSLSSKISYIPQDSSQSVNQKNPSNMAKTLIRTIKLPEPKPIVEEKDETQEPENTSNSQKNEDLEEPDQLDNQLDDMNDETDKIKLKDGLAVDDEGNVIDKNINSDQSEKEKLNESTIPEDTEQSQKDDIVLPDTENEGNLKDHEENIIEPIEQINNATPKNDILSENHEDLRPEEELDQTHQTDNIEEDINHPDTNQSLNKDVDEENEIQDKQENLSQTQISDQDLSNPDETQDKKENLSQTQISDQDLSNPDETQDKQENLSQTQISDQDLSNPDDIQDKQENLSQTQIDENLEEDQRPTEIDQETDNNLIPSTVDQETQEIDKSQDQSQKNDSNKIDETPNDQEDEKSITKSEESPKNELSNEELNEQLKKSENELSNQINENQDQTNVEEDLQMKEIEEKLKKQELNDEKEKIDIQKIDKEIKEMENEKKKMEELIETEKQELENQKLKKDETEEKEDHLKKMIEGIEEDKEQAELNRLEEENSKNEGEESSGLKFKYGKIAANILTNIIHSKGKASEKPNTDEEVEEFDNYRNMKITFDMRLVNLLVSKKPEFKKYNNDEFFVAFKELFSTVNSIISRFIKIKKVSNKMTLSKTKMSSFYIEDKVTDMKKFLMMIEKMSQTKIFTSTMETDFYMILQVTIAQNNILASAGPFCFDNSTGRSICGHTIINLNNLKIPAESEIQKYSNVMTVLHEVFHALAFNTSIYSSLAKDLDIDPKGKTLEDSFDSTKNEYNFKENYLKLTDDKLFKYLGKMKYIKDKKNIWDEFGIHWNPTYIPNDLMIPVERYDAVLSIFTLEYIEYISMDFTIKTKRKSLQSNFLMDEISDFKDFFEYECGNSEEKSKYSSFCTKKEFYSIDKGCNSSNLMKTKCKKNDYLTNNCYDNVSLKEDSCLSWDGSQGSKTYEIEERGISSRCVNGYAPVSTSGTPRNLTSYCLSVKVEKNSIVFSSKDGKFIVCKNANDEEELVVGNKKYVIICPDVFSYKTKFEKTNCPNMCFGNGFCSDGVCNCFEGFDDKTNCEEKLKQTETSTLIIE